IEAQLLRVSDLQASMESLDALLRNSPAYMMRSRQEHNTLMNDLTLDNVKKYLKDNNLSAENVDVYRKFSEMYNEASTSFANKKLERAFDDEVRNTLRSGDLKGAMNKAIEKNARLNTLGKLAQEEETTLAAKFVEGGIANVFSFTTIQMNALASSVKTAINPLARAVLSDPSELATRKQMFASYSAMRSSMGAAWRAAKASYRVEQSLLTRDPNKYLENALAIKGKKGGVLRTFIRATTATDEFLSQINYSSFIAGRATHDAVIEAQKRGYKGKRLDAYVRKATEKALADAYG
ncbi:hypothetical protein LCGC14_2619130, partial [marine sediment metagenome]